MTELLECLFSCDLKKLRNIFEKIDVNYVIPGTDGCTPLHVAAGMEKTQKKEDIISFLLEKGADPNARSYENLTPVHIAAMWDNCFELEKLLQNGGNPWLTDNENKNSFDMAADNHAYEAFQLLNTYLAEDKLNFKIEKQTCMSSSKVKRSFQACDQNQNDENSKAFASTMFTTANENFPLIMSSIDDESSNLILNMTRCIKRISLSKQKLNRESEKFNTSDTSISDPNEKCTNKQLFLKGKQSKNPMKNQQTNLNQAYYFSSTESETSDITSCTLNNTDDSSYETIIDKDDVSGIMLIETRSNANDYYSSNKSLSIASSWKSYQNVSSDCSTVSYCSTHSKSSVIIPRDIQEYSNSKIYQELLNLGDDPGPVLDHTRQVYLLRLARLKSGCKMSCDLPKPKYCPEIYQFMEKKLDMDRARKLELIIAAEFETDSDNKWREGNQRCCFNYFLLDPRVTQNLPSRASKLSIKETFLIFLDSLFYVGKGTRGRPHSHLLEAAKLSVAGYVKNDKISHILDIWETGLGVISLHCFQNSKPVEAYTREACIIEAVGLVNLTNIRKGDYYGSSARLTTSRKRLVGISLLDKALQIFLLEGERQIKPKDVQKK